MAGVSLGTSAGCLSVHQATKWVGSPRMRSSEAGGGFVLCSITPGADAHLCRADINLLCFGGAERSRQGVFHCQAVLLPSGNLALRVPHHRVTAVPRRSFTAGAVRNALTRKQSQHSPSRLSSRFYKTTNSGEIKITFKQERKYPLAH